MSLVHEGSWERQFPGPFRLAVRAPPSGQRRIGFVVPVGSCVLGRLGVGQPQDEILWWLLLQRQLHQWPEQFLSPSLLHIALRIGLLGIPQNGCEQKPLLWSLVVAAMDPLTSWKSLRRFLLAPPLAQVQWARTLVGHLPDMPPLE